MKPTESCGTCRFFVRTAQIAACDANEHGEFCLGECRRNAPLVLPAALNRPIGESSNWPYSHAAGWPVVRAGDWCGEYESP
jgi:hypothetical protein